MRRREQIPDGGSARVFALCGAVALGIVLVGTFHAPLAATAISVGTVLLLAIATRRRVLAVLVVALALGYSLAWLRLASLDDAALARGARVSADALLEGTVLGDPETAYGATRLTLGVRTAEIDGHPMRVRERAFLTIRPPPEQPLTANSIVRVDARLRPLFFAQADSAARAGAERLRRAGVAARAFAGPADVVVVGSSNGVLSGIAESGRAAVRRAASRMPAGEQSLLLGITIGDTSRLDPETQLDFRDTGLSHIVAVSGANVAMVLAVIALLLRWARAGRRTTVAVLSVSVVTFMAIARFEPSVLRAGAMACIALIGLAIGARRQTLTILGASVLVLLVIDPFLIYAPGFQLSTLATVGLLVLSPRIAARMPPGGLGSAAAITLGAQLAVAPVILILFGQISLVSVAANLLVEPMVAPATVLGMIAAGLGMIWAPLANVAVLAAPPIAWMQWIAHVLAQMPLASVKVPHGVITFILALVLAAWAIWLARSRAAPKLPARPDPPATPATPAPPDPSPSSRAHPSRRRRARTACVFALLLALTAGVWARALGPAAINGLRITMINVGQGEAILVRAQGHTMLIDGGPDRSGILRALREIGVYRIDLLVMTHPHADHIEGAVAVAARLPVARALDPYIPDDLPAYHEFIDALAQRGVPRDRAQIGMSYSLGNATIDVLWPPAHHIEGTPADLNNNSIVLRARFGQATALFAGETQEEAQSQLLTRPELLRAIVLKVAHHGSRHMLPAMYQATGARIALIPVGTNTFGHPAAETLAALRGMRVLRSDRNGTVTVTLDATGAATVDTERAGAG